MALYKYFMLTVFFSLPVSTSFSQGIFEVTPYTEPQIRELIAKHSVRIGPAKGLNPRLPENIYYRQVFLDILSHPALANRLPASDMEVIASLPAHHARQFVEQDLKELTSLCLSLGESDDSAESTIAAAMAFDLSRERREDDLNRHYRNVVASLTESTQRFVADHLLASDLNITYASYAMGALAEDAPDIARTILDSGCENLASKTEAGKLQEVLLKEQVQH